VKADVNSVGFQIIIDYTIRESDFLSHIKLWPIILMWGKLCDFIHYNVQYVMFVMIYIIHKNCKWRLGNDAYVLLYNMCHYLVSNCNFCVPYVTINVTYCNEWNPTIYLTQMSWAMGFCTIKFTFSCSEWMVHWWLLLLFVPDSWPCIHCGDYKGSASKVTCVGLVTDLFVNSYDFYLKEEEGGTKRLTNNWWSPKTSGLYQVLITSWK
jgi:hypothetical protein